MYFMYIMKIILLDIIPLNIVSLFPKRNKKKKKLSNEKNMK